MLKQIEDTQAKAAEYGLKLTPAEASNLNSLKAVQRYMLGNPVSTDILGEFFESRGLQISESFDLLMRDISEQPSMLLKEQGGIDAVNQQLKSLKTTRREATDRLYDKAYEKAGSVDIRESTGLLDVRIMKQAGDIQKSLKGIMSDLYREVPQPDGTMAKQLTDDIEVIHNVTKNIGDQINAAKNKGKHELSRELTRIKKTLEGDLEAASPMFRQAQDKYAELSGPVNELEKFYKPIIKSDDPQIQEIGQWLFGHKSNPAQVRKAKEILSAQGPEGEKAFADLATAWIEHKFANLADASGEISAKKIAKAFHKNKRERDMLAAALPEEQVAKVNDFIEVMDIIGRAPNLGSPTQSNQVIDEMLEKRSILKGAIKLFTQSPVKTAQEAFSDAAMESYMETLARAFTDPDAMNILQKEIKILKSKTSNVSAKQQALTSMGIKLAQLQKMWDSDEAKTESEQATREFGLSEGAMSAL